MTWWPRSRLQTEVPRERNFGLEPDVVLVAATSPGTGELVAQADPMIAVLAEGQVGGQDWTAVEVGWAGKADDDAAVLLGV